MRPPHVGGRQGKAGGPGIDFDELGVSDVVELLTTSTSRLWFATLATKIPRKILYPLLRAFLAANDRNKKVSAASSTLPGQWSPISCASWMKCSAVGLASRTGLADTTTWGE